MDWFSTLSTYWFTERGVIRKKIAMIVFHNEKIVIRIRVGKTPLCLSMDAWAVFTWFTCIILSCCFHPGRYRCYYRYCFDQVPSSHHHVQCLSDMLIIVILLIQYHLSLLYSLSYKYLGRGMNTSYLPPAMGKIAELTELSNHGW